MSKEAIDILEYMETVHTVECQGKRCNNVEQDVFDEVEFAKDLWKKGWRISRHGTLYCPDCSKKHIKSR
jgi:hypothetical protein